MRPPGHAYAGADYIRSADLRVRVIDRVYEILSAGAVCECGYRPDRTLMVSEWAAHVLEHGVDCRTAFGLQRKASRGPVI